jgi:hypothetical protein
MRTKKSGHPVNHSNIDTLAAMHVVVSLDDFFSYMPMHQYIFKPSGELWPASSINARLPPMARGDKTIPASAWLDANAAVEQMTWAPGEPKLIRDRLIAEGGWIARPGAAVFNLYRPPTLLAEPGSAEPWLELADRLFGDDANHMVKWLAHRVQRPHEKVNHALLLGGAQGIGKDTLLVPVRQAIGPWNFIEVSPQQLLGRFNGFLKSVICRVSEARDLGDQDRFAFYDHLKAYTAAPPDVRPFRFGARLCSSRLRQRTAEWPASSDRSQPSWRAVVGSTNWFVSWPTTLATNGSPWPSVRRCSSWRRLICRSS